MEKKVIFYGSLILVSSLVIYKIFKQKNKKNTYKYWEAILVDTDSF